MAKYHRLGKVLKRKDGKGRFISLGDPNNRKYPFSVDIRIRNNKEEVIFQGTDVIVNIQDPRDNPNLTEEQKERIPDFILEELTIIERDE